MNQITQSDIQEILFMKDTGVPADAIADLFGVDYRIFL